MGVGESTLDKWVRQLHRERSGRQANASTMTPDQRCIRKLERKLRRVEEETALLKSDSLNNPRCLRNPIELQN